MPVPTTIRRSRLGAGWRDALVAAPVARSACGRGVSTRSDIASSPSSGLEPAPRVRVGTPRTGTSAVARRTRSTGRGDRSLESTSRSAVLPSGFAAEAGPGGSSGATSVAAAEPGLDRRRGDARRGAEPRPAEAARWMPGPCVAAGSSGKGASGPLPREPDSGAGPEGRPPSSSTTTIRVAPAHGSTLASPSGDPASSTAARQRSATSLAGMAARSAGRSPVARQTSSAIIPSAIGSPSTLPAASGASSHSTRAARTSSDGPAGLAPVTHAVAIARTRNGSPWLANRARATFSPHRSARTCRRALPGVELRHAAGEVELERPPGVRFDDLAPSVRPDLHPDRAHSSRSLVALNSYTVSPCAAAVSPKDFSSITQSSKATVRVSRRDAGSQSRRTARATQGGRRASSLPRRRAAGRSRASGRKRRRPARRSRSLRHRYGCFCSRNSIDWRPSIVSPLTLASDAGR